MAKNPTTEAESQNLVVGDLIEKLMTFRSKLARQKELEYNSFGQIAEGRWLALAEAVDQFDEIFGPLNERQEA